MIRTRETIEAFEALAEAVDKKPRRRRRDPPALDTLIKAQILICDAILHFYHGNPDGLRKIVTLAIEQLQIVEANPYGNRLRD